MGSYTAGLEERIYEIRPDDDDYIEELLEVVKRFRGFGEAMSSFLIKQGYRGDAENREEKIAYLASRFRQSGIKVPRNLKKWFREPIGSPGEKPAGISRETAYQICFAFGLDAEETEDFFRRICLQRGFDRHDIRETVYHYALVHRMTYGEALQILSRIPEEESVWQAGPGQDIRFTADIVEETGKITDQTALVAYLREHRQEFRHSNVTAYRYIRKLWEEIVSDRGLAARERGKLYLDPHGRPGGKDKGSDSLWEIYLQILGLSGEDAAGLGTDRSLKPVLKDNKLLHPFAEDCFPDRDGLNKILKGEKVSYERVRKIMILLVFYRFWVRAALKSDSYEAKEEEGDRCLSDVENYLTDTGYPVLYSGNPFDWLIMFAAADEYPLLTFMDYMRELFYRKL